MKKSILIIVISLLTLSSKAQLAPGEYSSTNKKAISLFEKALEFYNARNDVKALEELKKAAEKDPAFIEPHILSAQIYTEANKLQEAITEYTKALEINAKFDKKVFFLLANIEVSIGKYTEAKQDYEAFLKNKTLNPDARDLAEHQLANCNFAIEAMKKPVPFEPKNMGEAINSSFDEYFPAITADDQTFLYTRNNRTTQVPMQEDFLVSKKVNNVWAPSVLLGNGINTPGNEGAPSISADGQVLFFIACAEIDNSYGPNRKGYGSCDIFYSQKVGVNWSRPYNIGNTINSKFWETQPCFSADGKTLYFVSSRPGGLGESDIYYSTLKDDGSWGTPINIGKKINTPGKEESVYIHPDGKTLYFSSNGHVGMGKLDIYVVRKDANNEWGTPVNLGYPINTYGDENSMLVNGGGNLAYMASNRAGGFGGLDLYQFELYNAVRPEQISYVKGKVYDAKTNQPLGAHFELIDLETAKQVVVSDANAGNGEFLVTLPVNKNYALNVSQSGYLFHSENFSLKDLADKTKPYQLDIPMESIDTGSVVELKNVFFETAKFDLKPESKVELDKLVAFLKFNKTLRIQLSGHTDNVGDKKMNQLLSQNRAKAVYDYLVANTIDANRLTFVGYGDTKPKVKNDSDENRAINRRTEFKVIGK
jgi:outer membrane protein OmpA-like peptidoglycan-associated protein/tetratricopeptide (TPR) repeat protein